MINVICFLNLDFVELLLVKENIKALILLVYFFHSLEDMCMMDHRFIVVKLRVGTQLQNPYSRMIISNFLGEIVAKMTKCLDNNWD